MQHVALSAALRIARALGLVKCSLSPVSAEKQISSTNLLSMNHRLAAEQRSRLEPGSEKRCSDELERSKKANM
jgi:hypothetical protein